MYSSSRHRALTLGTGQGPRASMLGSGTAAIEPTG
jgi:hypothetical protein